MCELPIKTGDLEHATQMLVQQAAKTEGSLRVVDNDYEKREQYAYLSSQ
jgi:hypothetical protein